METIRDYEAMVYILEHNKVDSTGIPMFYTNDHETMDMIRKEIDERFSFGFHIRP